MGAGIAQLAALAGRPTVLHDPDLTALERGLERARHGLRRGAERGRWPAHDAAAAADRLRAASDLAELEPCELVVEAAPERLEVKRELFAALAEVVAPDAVLATNTSSLLVTAVATGVPRPERVVGMHFFNPAPLMRLVEVVAGEQSGAPALAAARALGEAMGKHVIAAADGPGFLVNRCARPFGLEAQRVVAEGLASVEQVDRICRGAGGFRMGPFELSDLVGVDVGLAVARSFFEQSFGEPRWRPTPLAARVVAAGRHGRKAGHGWYRYDGDGVAQRAPDPPPPAPGGGDGLIVVTGELPVAEELRDLAGAAGWEVAADTAAGEVPFLIIDADPGSEAQGGPRTILCAEASLALLDPAGTASGFHALPPFGAAAVVEATRATHTSLLALERTEHFFGTLGKAVEWVGDAPGLVLGRIVAQLVNEAAFAVREGVGSEDDVDAGLVLGLNHPRGPFAWAREASFGHVLAVLEGLWEEQHDPAYRACPDLRRRFIDEG